MSGEIINLVQSDDLSSISSNTSSEEEEELWQSDYYLFRMGLSGPIYRPRASATRQPPACPADSLHYDRRDRRDRRDPRSNYATADEDDIEAVLRNPEIEEPQQALSSGIPIIKSRLQSLDIFPTNAQAGIITFTRGYLSQTFGGSTISTFTSPDQTKISDFYSGLRFMCLNLLYNAHSPQHPGAPGLYYALRDPSRWPWTRELVFCRYGANRWNYMGLYEMTSSDSLSSNEFCSLSQRVKETWYTSIWKYGWGNLTLASIYLRKHKGMAEPSEREVVLCARREIATVRHNITVQDVRTAFEQGHERINVWAMRCIGYDAEFKARLVQERNTVTRGKRHAEGTGERVAKRRKVGK